MAFNRDRNSRSGGGGFRPGGRPGGRPRFGDRSDRGPIDLHKAICDNCGKECEVPFRPTSGKPVFCSNCFENKRGADSGRFEGSPRFAGEAGRNSERSEERQMFDAVCADCGNACSVPFRPSGDKPVFCSNCFGEKKNAGGKENGQSQSQYTEQFTSLNQKLDKILSLLTPAVETKEIEKEIKVVKKRSPKKTK